MNTSVHFALGVFFASITNILEPLTFLTFSVVLCGSFAVDFDFLFLKFSKQENHRLFFTHSIYPPLIILIVGLITMKFWIIMCAVGYFSHLFIDMIDWGVGLFYFDHKIRGWQILFKRLKKQNINDLKELGNSMSWTINTLYLRSPLILFFEFCSAILMVVSLILYAPNFWYFIFGYIAAVGLHVMDYFESKRSHSGKEVKTFLIRGQ